MNAWLKTLIAVALVVPLAAYVTVSLLSAGARGPVDHRPVIIEDVTSPARQQPRPSPARTPHQDPDDGEVAVLTPAPTPVDDDDDRLGDDDSTDGEDDDELDGDDGGDDDD